MKEPVIKFVEET